MPEFKKTAESGFPKMSGQRIRLAHLVIFTLIAGSAFDIITGREHWPFSPYPMYSNTFSADTLSKMRLFGVAQGDRAVEIPIYAFPYIQPFDRSRLYVALERMRRKENGRRLLRDAVRDCLRRYERLRAAGRHDGPPLRAMRFYEVHWRLDPWARNADKPDSRTLLFEVGFEEN